MSDFEVGRDYSKAPANLCPHCKQELHLVIDAFKPEITKVVRSNCPHCNQEIFAAVMIITDVTHRGILNSIQAVLDMFNPQLITTVDNPNKEVGNA